jgi:hypothetical protein
MKNHLSLYAHSHRSILLTVSAIGLMAFAGCSGVDGTAGNRPTANMLTEEGAKHPDGGHVTIGPRNYNPETLNFDRPWPFGPESNSQ